MSSARRDETVTLMYMAGQTGQIRRFGVRRSWLRRGVAAAAVCAALVSAVMVDYVRLRRKVGELPGLRSETQQQREQIAQYADKLEEISQHLQRVAQLDRKLRVITNLDPSDPLPLPGVGGLGDSWTDSPGLERFNREGRHKHMLDEFGQLSQATQSQATSLDALLTHLKDQSAQLASTPSIAPTKGWITSGFGYRVSPFTGGRELHRGLDIAGRMRTPVVAPADGEVLFVGSKQGFGNTVTLRHGYGMETIYGHLAELSVKQGQHVARGERIGLMGNSGRSTGPHLHYQVQVNGNPVDPQNYILD